MKNFILVLCMVFFSTIAIAQTQEQTITIPKSKATAEQISAYENKQKVEAVNEWVGLGKEVGIAMSEGLSALNTEVNKFSESPAGKFTMFIIAWKVLGNDVVQFIIGFPLWVIGTLYFMVVFWRNCVTRTVLDKVEGKVKTYKVVNQSGEYSRSDELTHMSMVRWGHFIAYAIFTAIMSALTLT